LELGPYAETALVLGGGNLVAEQILIDKCLLEGTLQHIQSPKAKAPQQKPRRLRMVLKA